MEKPGPPWASPVSADVRSRAGRWAAVVWVNVPPTELVAISGELADTPTGAVAAVAEWLVLLHDMTSEHLSAWAAIYREGDDPAAVARSVRAAYGE